VLEERPPMDWFEIISENFMVRGGRPLENLERLLASYRVVNHGVSMSIGASTPLDTDYLAKLKALLVRVKPPWCSDHLCWGQAEQGRPPRFAAAAADQDDHRARRRAREARAGHARDPVRPRERVELPVVRR